MQLLATYVYSVMLNIILRATLSNNVEEWGRNILIKETTLA